MRLPFGDFIDPDYDAYMRHREWRRSLLMDEMFGYARSCLPANAFTGQVFVTPATGVRTSNETLGNHPTAAAKLP